MRLLRDDDGDIWQPHHDLAEMFVCVTNSDCEVMSLESIALAFGPVQVFEAAEVIR